MFYWTRTQRNFFFLRPNPRPYLAQHRVSVAVLAASFLVPYTLYLERGRQTLCFSSFQDGQTCFLKWRFRQAGLYAFARGGSFKRGSGKSRRQAGCRSLLTHIGQGCQMYLCAFFDSKLPPTRSQGATLDNVQSTSDVLKLVYVYICGNWKPWRAGKHCGKEKKLWDRHGRWEWASRNERGKYCSESSFLPILTTPTHPVLKYYRVNVRHVCTSSVRFCEFPKLSMSTKKDSSSIMYRQKVVFLERSLNARSLFY